MPYRAIYSLLTVHQREGSVKLAVSRSMNQHKWEVHMIHLGKDRDIYMDRLLKGW
jgi:hypothetical protein